MYIKIIYICANQYGNPNNSNQMIVMLPWFLFLDREFCIILQCHHTFRFINVAVKVALIISDRHKSRAWNGCGLFKLLKHQIAFLTDLVFICSTLQVTPHAPIQRYIPHNIWYYNFRGSQFQRFQGFPFIIDCIITQTKTSGSPLGLSGKCSDLTGKV